MPSLVLILVLAGYVAEMARIPPASWQWHCGEFETKLNCIAGPRSLIIIIHETTQQADARRCISG